MNYSLTTKFLIFFLCSLNFAIVLSQTDYSQFYPFDNSFCAFPFTYEGKTYTNCTTDGDNGDIPWCSVTQNYTGLIGYCYNFCNTSLQCLPFFTMPNGKNYTGCDYLSPTTPYKQCKTYDPVVKYRYCTDALDNKCNQKPTLKRRQDCEKRYLDLSYDHTMCYVNPYANVSVLSDSDKQDLLDMHNQYRASVTSAYMFKLYWDDELAKLAQAHSSLCAFEHDLAVNRLSPLFRWTNGQNIVMSTEIRSSAASLIDMMLGGEQVNFRYGNTCYPGENTCLHYTQALISNLTRMGCGQTNCVYPDRIERYLTCNYMLSQYEDNYQTPYVPSDTPASACPLFKTSDGLCDCGNKICAYDVNEYLNPATCNCTKPSSKRSINKRDATDDELASGTNHYVALPIGKGGFTPRRHKRHFHHIKPIKKNKRHFPHRLPIGKKP